MFLLSIERPSGLSMKMGYYFMTKLELVENKTLSQAVVRLTYELARSG